MYKDLVDRKGGYNTPLYLFNYLHKHFKFELDPCDSGDKWLGLPYNYTEQENGLSKSWKVNTFVNPPYGSKQENLWVLKCVKEAKENDIVVFLLLPSKTEATWFSYAMTHASLVLFPRGRIHFVKHGKTKSGNTMGSVLFGFFVKYDPYMRTKHGKMADEFYQESRWVLNFDAFLGNDSQIILFPDKRVLKKEYDILPR